MMANTTEFPYSVLHKGVELEYKGARFFAGDVSIMMKGIGSKPLDGRTYSIIPKDYANDMKAHDILEEVLTQLGGSAQMRELIGAIVLDGAQVITEK